jgi:arsenate reductase
MAEAGVDISGHVSKRLDRYRSELWDYLITVCDQANESCPFFPGGRHRLHWSFSDPSQAIGNEEEQLEVYRRVRDDIKERMEQFIKSQQPDAR